MIKKTNAQAISRVLRAEGYNPHSSGGSNTRWVALACTRSADEVRVRVWSNPDLDHPSQSDRETAAAIAGLLTESGYKIRYETGSHYLYVAGKES